MMTNTEKELLKLGKLLPVMEHFYTIQGEGAYTGKAAYFIRLGGCDVGCHWCDVKESWDPNLHPLMDAEEVAQIAANHSKTIVLTGGEPLMWNLEILTKKLKDLGCTIHIETSGAYEMTGHIDWVCLSPKKTGPPKESIYAKANELKVIIFNNHDFKFAEEQASKVSQNCKFYLQSEWSKRDEMYPKITDYILENPKWQASVQTHKYLNIP
ncbi:7-carboxy-7-deazaguanine synthase QueE [Riemerella anatipestifer]|uniref:7-carboxy-7-deazaguanine synthase QueE n=1 Tax=Riemerella anatipestifer TaxID=34085 RepID=UPI000B307F8C|nr:7-carboxy-7-deazaguanine synthase QueE [Riemerella anatipestifer]MBO4233989.1 7-carboxy-7-deazaguanine synthase QueE [Riemerella anatipestifer]MDY3351810.1 7-carboxy-7-deazaguanine synthase QueE [Riemerella anatipestifer]